MKTKLNEGLNIFSASWCNPCKMLKAQLDSASIKYNTIDIDTSPELCEKYNIRGVPVTVVIVEGEEVERFIGMNDFKKIIEVGNGNND